MRTSLLRGVTAAKRFETIWAKMIGTFETHRSLWIANLEIFMQMVSQPMMRGFLANNLHMARTGLAAMFLNQAESAISDHTARTIGTFHHVILSGLIVQWLIDPESALSAKDLTEALRRTADRLGPEKKASGRKARRQPAKAKKSR